MKIVIINGQNHKGSTYHVGKLLVDNIIGEKEISEFFLPQDLNHFCAGCYSCIQDERKCPYYEEKNEIMKVVEAADLLLLTTPNYCMAPSAPMKAFMDMTFTYWISHKPRKCMYTKRAVVISTTAGAGANQAIKPVKTMLSYWGIPSIKTYGISVQAMNWAGVPEKKKEKISKDMQKMASTLSQQKKVHVPLKNKLMFGMMRKLQQANMGSDPVEKSYWEQQGWLGKKRPWKEK